MIRVEHLLGGQPTHTLSRKPAFRALVSETLPVFVGVSTSLDQPHRLNPFNQQFWHTRIAGRRRGFLGLGREPLSFTHAFLRYEMPVDYQTAEGDQFYLNWIYHSTGVGSHWVSYDVFLKEREPFIEWAIDVSPIEFWESAIRCADNGVVKYPKGEIIGIGLARAWEAITGKRVKENPWTKGTGELFCSETAQREVKRLRPSYDWDGRSSDMILPVDLAKGMKVITEMGQARVAYVSTAAANASDRNLYFT